MINSSKSEKIEGNLNNEINFDALYEQCNNHLMESDKKRDQILVILTSITGLYVGNLEKLKNMVGFDILSVCIIVIGIIFSRMVLEYRKWHIKYSLACTAIQRLMYTDENINQEYITKVLRSIVTDTKFLGLFKTTETLMFNLYLGINLINIYICMTTYGINKVYIYITILIYFCISNYFYYRSIKKLCNKEKIKSSDIWIINLFGKEMDGK